MAQAPKAKGRGKGKNIMAAIADMLRQKAMAGRPGMRPPMAIPQGGAAPSPDSMMQGTGMPPGSP